jgi:hypothetical protein
MCMIGQMPHMRMDARPVVMSVPKAAPQAPKVLQRGLGPPHVALTSTATHQGPRGTRAASTLRSADRRCPSSRRWRLERCRGWDLQLIDMDTGTPAALGFTPRTLRRGGLKPRRLIGPASGVPGVPVYTPTREEDYRRGYAVGMSTSISFSTIRLELPCSRRNAYPTMVQCCKSKIMTDPVPSTRRGPRVDPRRRTPPPQHCTCRGALEFGSVFCSTGLRSFSWQA